MYRRDKGKYNGCRMAVYGSIIPRSGRLARIPDVSRTARLRLRWIDYYNSHGRNASLTCRHFGISRQTFYRWKRRYEREGIKGLEDRSRRPKKVRRPTWSLELEQEVKRLREQYPRWGKDKLARLEPLKGRVSVSMVGRMLRHLKATGRLREPLLRAVSGRKRRKRRYAIRMPKDYVVKEAGDLVQMDVKYVGIVPGVGVKHFSAKDVISKWNVMEVHARATSRTAKGFLDAVEGRMPFRVKAIQVDGGSEFLGEFERECERRGIILIRLPPRSPKLNGAVERAIRTHTEEFYEVADLDWRISVLNKQLMEYERVYNEVRPHQALGYLTPKEWLEKYWLERASAGETERATSHPSQGRMTNGPPAVWRQLDAITHPTNSHQPSKQPSVCHT